MVHQPFAAGGNQLYLDFWAIIGDLRFLGYKTPTVALEPIIKWVAGAIHSTGDIIGTHMLLWVLPRDLMVRPLC
jgi:hypothetical protein